MRKSVLILFVLSFVLVGCGKMANSANDYNQDLNSLVTKIESNALTAGEMLIVYSTVWDWSGNFILPSDLQKLIEIEKSEIEKYFGLFTDTDYGEGLSLTIDEAVNGVKLYYSDMGKIEELQTNSENISNKLKELKEPPQEYQEYYNNVMDLYLLHEKYIEMAINPSGSLIEYNKNANELASDIKNKMNEIEIIMPNEEESE